jgi:hypothetical protein
MIGPCLPRSLLVAVLAAAGALAWPIAPGAQPATPAAAQPGPQPGRPAGAPASAQELRSLEQRLDESQKQIEQLRETLEQLSSGLGRRVSHTGVPIHGFADAGAGWSSREDPARLRGFGVGTLDLYLTPQFGDHVKSLMEIAFYYRTDGAGEIEAERMQLGYALDDALTVWVGRFHTPIGLWNTAYHHGANLQTSISRPRFIDFEDRDGVLPTHSIGLWGNGKTDIRSGKLAYDIYLTNGPTVRRATLDYNAFSDDNAGKLLGFNLLWRPNAARGASLGVHGFGSTVDTRLASGALHARTRVRMWGGHFGYDAQPWEAMAELYRFANADVASGASRSSQAGYVQLGRSFAGFTPYLRHERAALDGADNFFATQRVGRSYTRSLLGARYDLDPKAALKVELSTTHEKAATLLDDTGAAAALAPARYRRLAVEYSIAF